MLYLTTVFAYGVAAHAGAAAGRGRRRCWATISCLPSTPRGTFELSPLAIQAQIIIAPGACAGEPGAAVDSVSITVREAISYYGLRAEPTLLDRFMARLRYLPELLALTISNTFVTSSVILTEITLVLSGLIFMAVMTTRDSAHPHLGEPFFHSALRCELRHRTRRNASSVQDIALSYPGVEAVEAWYLQNAEIRPGRRLSLTTTSGWPSSACRCRRICTGRRWWRGGGWRRTTATPWCSTRRWPTKRAGGGRHGDAQDRRRQ